jgi:hypothetical protein
MRRPSAIIIAALALSIWACAGGDREDGTRADAPDEAAALPDSVSATPEPLAPPATPAAQNGDSCADLEADVTAAARAAGACTQDKDCRVERLAKCGLDGLDCYAVHVGTGSFAAVESALAAHTSACRQARRCRCQIPVQSVCTKGHCARP